MLHHERLYLPCRLGALSGELTCKPGGLGECLVRLLLQFCNPFFAVIGSIELAAKVVADGHQLRQRIDMMLALEGVDEIEAFLHLHKTFWVVLHAC